MSSSSFDLRGVVMMWTILTTTFMWTPTMRLLLKPEISHWSLFGTGGVGGQGPFWVLPLISLGALTLFYLEGRGRLRPLFHVLLLGWYLPMTAGLLYGSLQQGDDAVFTGAAWGVTLPFSLLAVPFVFFTALAVCLILQEVRGSQAVPRRSWSDVNITKLALAALLLPVAAVFFRMGEGFDVLVKMAIVATVLQWILLAEALGPQTAKRTPEADPEPVAPQG